MNHLCLHCCASEGMVLGTCFVCQHDGPAWEKCHWCERGLSIPPGSGQCRECGWYGVVGDNCTGCDDDVYAPIPEDTGSDSDSSNVLLDIVVAADPPTDTDSDTDSEHPVASRTRSSLS